MELENIIFDASTLKKFIDERFKSIEISHTEKFKTNHPMWSENFNRTPRDQNIQFTIFGKEVLLMLVYEKDGKFCTNLLLEAKIPADFNAFVDNLGIPDNTSIESYISGDFKFLAWEKGEFEIFINKVHAGKEHRHHFIAKVFNFPEHYDTVDTRRLGYQ